MGGVLGGKVGVWMCGPDRVPFWPLRFIVILKLLKIKVVFFKMLVFNQLFCWFYL